MTAACIAIVGAGQAGARAALALRRRGWAGRLLLIGDEAHPPYERPALSKQALLLPQTPPTWVTEHGQYAAQGIELTLATRVTALDTARHRLTVETVGEPAQTVRYDTLLLATGGRARRLELPGASDPRVLTLRHADDAVALASRLRPGQTLVVVGGGFIGLEIAAAARQRGCAVDVLEAGPRLLGRAVPASLAARVQALHVARGVNVHLSDGPVAFEPQAGRLRVRLALGGMLTADTVVVGIGMTPEVALARQAGLCVRRGIVVDNTLKTSADDVYAAGDACEFPAADGGTVVLESWANAEAQAERVAANMLGDVAPYEAASWMWSDQFDHTLQMVGRCSAPARVVTRLLADGQLDFFVDADHRIVGAAGFAPTAVLSRAFAIARRLVEMAARPSAADLMDPQRSLKSLLAA